MRSPKWVQTIACTRPNAHPHSKWDWVDIYADDYMILWTCKQDLKNHFVREAKRTFGKTLEQVIRLGNTPSILYPGIILEE